MSTVGEQLADFIQATSIGDLSPRTIELAKSRVLDAITTAITARDLAVPGLASAFVRGNTGRATLIGSKQRVPAIDAALVNATLINGSSLDDFLEKSHPAAVVVPAAMAVADEQGNTGAEFLTSIVLGYELVGRAYLGAPGMLPKFRATGVAGAVGAAAAAGKLLRLPAPEMMHALGYAAMFASGFGEGFLSGTMEVKLNVGWACRSGVSAARLAQLGGTASALVFEGKSGFFRAFGGDADHAADALHGLGEHLLIEDAIYKEYPVCIFVQTPMYLAQALVKKHGLDPARITQVSIHAPKDTFENPGFQNIAPYGNQLQARTSASFCTAAALLGKPVDEHDFYDRTTDPDVLALAAKVQLLPPSADTQRVTVQLVCGAETFEISALQMEMLRPTMEKIVAKFRRLAGPAFGDNADRVIDTVMRLEHVRHIAELTELLRLDPGSASGLASA
jgi:2-methylcitrate dehydratase PrpD